MEHTGDARGTAVVWGSWCSVGKQVAKPQLADCVSDGNAQQTLQVQLVAFQGKAASESTRCQLESVGYRRRRNWTAMRRQAARMRLLRRGADCGKTRSRRDGWPGHGHILHGEGRMMSKLLREEENLNASMCWSGASRHEEEPDWVTRSGTSENSPSS